MLKQETVINRFIRTYGDIRPLKNLPCVQSDYAGLSFEPQTIYGIMLLKLPSIPNIEQKHPLDCLPEIEYLVDGQKVAWSTDELVKGFRVLDTKPFNNLTVTISDTILPLMVTRNDGIGVFLTPHVYKMKMNDAIVEAKKKLTNWQVWNTGKFQGKWIQQFHPWSTLWLVEFNEDERLIKCRNPDCHMEITVQDYFLIHYEKHQECTCTCNAWQCPMDCYRNRQRRAFETKMRELSNRKRFWRRKFT